MSSHKKPVNFLKTSLAIRNIGLKSNFKVISTDKQTPYIPFSDTPSNFESEASLTTGPKVYTLLKSEADTQN